MRIRLKKMYFDLVDNISFLEEYARQPGYLTIDMNRIKRYDYVMKNDCSSHETGLGLAYYSLAIQKYLEKF